MVYADFISRQCQAGMRFKKVREINQKSIICGVKEYANIWNNHALGEKFLKFGMVLGMGRCALAVFSKSIARKMGVTSGDL